MGTSRVLLYRPPGGKTVTARLELDDGCRIRRVVFTGDFFVYPEEAFEQLEQRLAGCETRSCVLEAFRAVAATGAKPIGFTWEGLSEALLGEWEEACRAAAPRQGSGPR